MDTRQDGSGSADEPRLCVLGSVALRTAGNDAAFHRSTRMRRVFAGLVINRGELVSADRLAEIAWGHAPPADPRAALHNLVSRLRTLLAGVDGVHLVTRPPGYLLQAPRAVLDATEFEDRVLAARRTTDLADASTQLDSALALWRGPAFAEFADEDFARAEAVRLGMLRQLAQEHRVKIMLASGAHEQAVGHLESIIADGPLRDRPRELLMIALYRSGRLADALSSYRDYRRVLDRELGLEPGQSLRDLERRMLRRDPALMLPVESPPAAESPRAVESPPATEVAPGAPMRSGLLGRAEDLAAADELLRNRPILTFVGVGGVGKTQLARHLIRQVAARYPDGVIVCDLGAISDHGQIAGVIAAALGVIPEPGQQLAEQVIAAVSARRALLFLDNCEHVLAAAAEIVDRIMTISTTAAVLATSRERLGVHDEQLWQVNPLPEATSVALFTARARAVNPAFAPTPAIAELCQRLDGIPLAIELAAARTSGMTVPEILSRLDGQSHLLDSSRSAMPSRHRSLRTVIDWSYDLLSPAQQAVFDQLAVFPDDFSLDAAAGVVDAGLSEPQVAAVVLDLVDRSLVKHVTHGSRSRYTLLDTLRRYGRGHLAEQARLEHLHGRHAAWYLELAGDLGLTCGATRSDWIRRLDQETPNLRAAHRWLHSRKDAPALLRLAESLHYYGVNSLNPEVFEWASETLGLFAESEDPLIAAVYATAAGGAWLAGDVAKSRALAERGVSVAARTANPSGRYALVALGHALAAFGGQFGVRADLYHEAARLATATPHRLIAELFYGSCLTQLGRARAGRDVVDRALREAGEIESPDIEAKAELVRADIMLTDEPTDAIAAYWRAADLNARAGNRYQEFQAMISAAFAEIMYGDRRTAATTFRTLLTRWPGLLRDAPLFCVMQGVVILLAGAGRNQQAAVLAGAIPNDTVTIAFTIDERVVELFRATTRAAETDLGPVPFADAARRGRLMERPEIFEFALATLDQIDGA